VLALGKIGIVSLAFAAAITLPFVVWNPASFYRSVVLMQMHQPFRIESLSFTAMLARETGIRLPSLVGLFAAMAMLTWALRKAPRSAAGFAASTALVLLIFFAFNKQAFCNYYFAVIGACCAGAALSHREKERTQIQMSSDDFRMAA